MTANRHGIVAAASFLIAGTMLAGCQSPTYGTDKTASDQLVSDVSNIFSLGPTKRTAVDYKPRPTLVRPSKAETASLPSPQDSVASAGNAAWVESPEEKRARLRAEADENSNDPSWRPQIDADMARDSAARFPREKSSVINTRSQESGVQPTGTSTALQAQQFKQKMAETRQGSPTSRKYLSEPPTEYRAGVGRCAGRRTWRGRAQERAPSEGGSAQEERQDLGRSRPLVISRQATARVSGEKTL